MLSLVASVSDRVRKIFDLYGSSLALQPAVREAEAALGISFEPHESSCRGGD
jgi:hypothetical protein